MSQSVLDRFAPSPARPEPRSSQSVHSGPATPLPVNILRAPPDFIGAALAGPVAAEGTCHSSRFRPCPGTGSRSIGESFVRAEMRTIARDWPCYGHRRIARELSRRGLRTNRKRVRRLMRLMGIRAVPRGLAAAPPAPGGRDRPNLLRGLDIDRPDMVWVADFTIIRLPSEPVFLAAILDAYTRRCIGWAIGRRHSCRLVLTALRMALAARKGKDLGGLIHHTDQGFVYSSKRYTKALRRNGIGISQSRRGMPSDNARMEGFFSTLKCERVYLGRYAGYEEAQADLGDFIEEVYNEKRLHSAIGYRPPAEFERAAGAA